MLAWVMNLGFGASEAATQAPPPGGASPYGMGMGDELWLAGFLLAAIGGLFK